MLSKNDHETSKLLRINWKGKSRRYTGVLVKLQLNTQYNKSIYKMRCITRTIWTFSSVTFFYSTHIHTHTYSIHTYIMYSFSYGTRILRNSCLLTAIICVCEQKYIHTYTAQSCNCFWLLPRRKLGEPPQSDQTWSSEYLPKYYVSLYSILFRFTILMLLLYNETILPTELNKVFF